MNQSIIIMAIIVAGVAAWGTWHMKAADRARLETEAVRRSLTMAESEIQTAAAINRNALDQLAHQASEVERQKLIAAAEAKKSRERLNAFNALNRKISNVPTSQNVPVSDHIEHVLDELRSAIPGSGQASGGADESSDAKATDTAGRDVPNSTGTATEAPGS